MHGWLGCLLLLLVATTNAAGVEHDLTEVRAEMRSMRLELMLELEVEAKAN